jgi:hypothetical protein
MTQDGQTRTARDQKQAAMAPAASDAELRRQGADMALQLIAAILADDPDLQGGAGLRRVSGHLRLCADLPDLAAAMLGCEAEDIDPQILRSAAHLLSRPGADQSQRPNRGVGAVQ